MPYDLEDVPIGRINIAGAMMMQEAYKRAHKEFGSAYIPTCRLATILMDVNEEVTRYINNRMATILQGEADRAKADRKRLGCVTTT